MRSFPKYFRYMHDGLLRVDMDGRGWWLIHASGNVASKDHQCCCSPGTHYHDTLITEREAITMLYPQEPVPPPPYDSTLDDFRSAIAEQLVVRKVEEWQGDADAVNGVKVEVVLELKSDAYIIVKDCRDYKVIPTSVHGETHGLRWKATLITWIHSKDNGWAEYLVEELL